MGHGAFDLSHLLVRVHQCVLSFRGVVLEFDVSSLQKKGAHLLKFTSKSCVISFLKLSDGFDDNCKNPFSSRLWSALLYASITGVPRPSDGVELLDRRSAQTSQSAEDGEFDLSHLRVLDCVHQSVLIRRDMVLEFLCCMHRSLESIVSNSLIVATRKRVDVRKTARLTSAPPRSQPRQQQYHLVASHQHLYLNLGLVRALTGDVAMEAFFKSCSGPSKTTHRPSKRHKRKTHLSQTHRVHTAEEICLIAHSTSLPEATAHGTVVRTSFC